MPAVADNAFPHLDPAKMTAVVTPPSPVQPQTFELGLVLGGTVSAGAYTAGALDLLTQALDAWAATIDRPHSVQMRLAAGSSGGAVCAAILAAMINRKFTPVSGTQDALAATAGPVDNKFWDVWVNQLSFLPMLDTDDLNNVIAGSAPPQHVPALLNARPIDDVTKLVVEYAKGAGEVVRPWAEAPFRIATTVCNLRGMPFTVRDIPPIGTFTGNAFVEHDDFAWFAVPNVLGTGDGDIESRRANEFWLSHDPREGVSVPFDVLGDFARASGAMPVGLPARPLSRPPEQYLYRPYGRIDDTGTIVIAWPQPDWSELQDVLRGGPYSFTGVDGGTLNNDPVKLAHSALSGIGIHNPRDPGQANRALLMIDPLVDQPVPLDPIDTSLLAVAEALVGTFVGGARYLTADLDLFQDEDVFSRFQLVPNRLGLDGRPLPNDIAPTGPRQTPAVGSSALAGTDFFALAGWFTREFRVHDFLLGRLNMASYLRRELMLTGDNALFAKWPAALVAKYAQDAKGNPVVVGPQTSKKSYFLPIIPMPDDNFGVTAPVWPQGKFDPTTLETPIETRVAAVLGSLRSDNLPGFGGWFVSILGLAGLADTIAKNLVTNLTATFANRKLWPATPATDV